MKNETVTDQNLSLPVPEEKIREFLNVSASTLRSWRRSGLIIHSYVKVGNKFFYDVEKLRKEMWENGER